MSDDRKVHDLTMRRQQQLQNHPLLRMADKLVKVVVEFSPELSPADQLVAIELTARATLETLRHAKGEEALNQIIVEFQDRCRFYTIEWPEHDQSRTVFDGTDDQLGDTAMVIPLHHDEKEEDV